MDCVKFAAGRAKAAAKADILIDMGSTTTEAAASFCFYLFRCKGATFILKGKFIFLQFSRHLTWRGVKTSNLNQRILFVDCFVIASVTTKDKRVAFPDSTVERHSALLTSCNGINAEFLASIDITADKDIWFCGSIGEGICNNKAIALKL